RSSRVNRYRTGLAVVIVGSAPAGVLRPLFLWRQAYVSGARTATVRAGWACPGFVRGVHRRALRQAQGTATRSRFQQLLVTSCRLRPAVGASRSAPTEAPLPKRPYRGGRRAYLMA